jgi:polyhydroxybutyrate depolymerase
MGGCRTGLGRAALLFLLLQGSLAGGGPAECRCARNLTAALEVAGTKRLYKLHLPASPQERPLVLVFHGGMQNGAVIRKITGMDAEADRENFTVVYPYGSGRLKKKFLMWNAYDCCGFPVEKKIDDVAFVSALIEELSACYKIDRTRVYACGFSNGAMFVYRLAAELSEKIAAVASVGGSMSGKEKAPAVPVSVLVIHGTADRHVPYEGGAGKWARVGYPVNKESVAYAVDFWKKADACNATAQVVDEKNFKMETYASGREGSEVRLITLKGIGHTWPGGRPSMLYMDRPVAVIDTTHECWQFFARHRRIVVD